MDSFPVLFDSIIFDCNIDIIPVNDAPYFSDLGDITIDEDITYDEVWAFNISPGAYNEDDELTFNVSFEDETLIESYSMTSDGNLIIVPVPDKYGETIFNIFSILFHCLDIFHSLEDEKKKSNKR